MYLEHFNLLSRPFTIAPNPRFVYLSPQHREALAHLLYGVQVGGGFVVLTGEVGTGKTTLCRCLMEQLPDDVDMALIFNPRLSARELLANICDELHIAHPGGLSSIKVLIDRLNHHLLEAHAAGRRTVVLIDEAQNLRRDVLEQVRLLTNLETNESKLLQIMLVGQPELRGMLAEDKLRQLSQRITARFHLDPLSYDNTRQYIQHRLAVSGAHGPIFTSGAIARVHCYSKGIPRLINLICDRALLGAYTLGRIDVTPAIVNKAAREILAHPKPSLRVRPAIRILAASAVLTAAVIGIGGWGMVADAPHSWIAWWPTAASPPDETPPPAVAGGPGPASSRAGAADQSPAQPQAVAAAQEGHTPPTPAEPTAAVPVSAAAVDTAVPAAGLSAPQTADPQPVAIAAAPSGTPDPASQAAVPPPPAVEAAADAAPAASSPNAVDTATPPPSGEGLDSTALAASPPPPLANRLAELPAGPAWGDRILAGLWGVEAGKPGEHCQTAKSQGLRCFNFDGDWQTLLNLAHPALLELHLADGSQRSVPLLRLDQGQPVLDLAGTAVTVSSRDLLPLWRGKALIVWRPPAGYSGSMELGRRGADVRWLRQQLSVPAKAGQEDRYDAPLQNRVAAFQQQHGLQRDGSAGPLTLITLGAPMAAGPRLGTGPISPQN